MKNKKLLFGIFLAFLFLASFGFTYAYFNIEVSGNDQVKLITTTTGTLEITYNGGQEIKVEDIYPGWTQTKTFTVENTGTLDAYYSLDWDDLINTITNDELIMSLSCTGNGCKTISNQVVGNIEGPFITGIEIKPGIIHSYTITLTFLETSSAQNYNQGKRFIGKISIENSLELVTIYGTLVDSNNTLIPNAIISLHSIPHTTTTDENGNFIFENVEVDNHTVTASLNNEELLEDEIIINNGNTNIIDNKIITKTINNKEIKVKIQIGNNNTIDSIEKVHYTLSPSFITKLGIEKRFIIAISVEKDLNSPETYTYNGVTYNRNINGRDVSENTDGTVLASTYTDGTNDVIIMINSRGKTSLPEDSSNLFSHPNNAILFGFIKVEYIQSENFDTSQVTNMSNMFWNIGEKATTFNLDVSNWDTSNVTNMGGMFSSSVENINDFNLDFSSWNTSQVTDMSYMFASAGRHSINFDIDLSNWNTSKVTNMNEMFGNSGNKSTTWNIGNIGKWNTSEVTNMVGMFSGAGQKASVFNLDLSNWNTSKVTNMYLMFSIAGGEATSWSIGDLSKWDTSQVTDMSYMFKSSGELSTHFNLNLSGWNTSKVTNMEGMFSGAGRFSTTSIFNIKGFNLNTSNTVLTSYSNIFGYMNDNSQIIVGSTNTRDWILSLDSSNKPNWTTSNFIIDTTQ